MNDTEPKHHNIEDIDEFRLAENAEVRVLILGFDEVFLAEAKKAAERATQALAQGDAPAVAGATAASVLLAAAACESRLSENVTRRETEIDAATVAAIRDHGDALKQWQLLLGATAPAFQPGGSKQYLALGCLFKLRDLVAHRNARYLPPGEWPKTLADCVRQKSIPVHEATGIDWTSGVYVQRVGVWAHQTAAEWLVMADTLGIVAK